MSEPLIPQPSTETPKLPPFVQIVMQSEGMEVKTNITDKLAVLALLEGAKFSVMQPEKPMVQPVNGLLSGMLKRMGK